MVEGPNGVTSPRAADSRPEFAARSWAAARNEIGPVLGTIVLPFVLVLYLALQGGGYDAVVRGEIGVAIWWIVLLGALVGVLPTAGISRAGWVALAILAALAIWSTLAISWSESEERTVVEVARIATYAGVLALALSVQGKDGLRRTVSAVGAALAVVAALALLSRVHPSWFPPNDAGAVFHMRSRLNYPVNYWNGLAALMAIGIPLMLALALDGRRLLGQALATAAIPVMALTAFYTLSRGGAVEVVIGFAAFVALYPRRLAALPTLLLTTAASALVIVAATQRHALEDGLSNAAALHQGNSMLAFVLVTCAGAALLRIALSLAERYELLQMPRLSRRAGVGALGVSAAVAMAVAIAAGAPSAVDDAWHDFKQPLAAKQASSVERFQSASGNGRYQYWKTAVDAGKSEPLTGIGPGTYEYYWARNGSLPGFVRDAHSLFLESFAELGIPGLLLVLIFVTGIVAVAAARALTAAAAHRPWCAAAAASACAFTAAAAIDWVWELAVIPACFLLLAGAVLSATGRRPARPRVPTRAAVSVLAVIALVAIAVPLAGTSSVRASQAAVGANDLGQALDDARGGSDIEPWAASPHLQQALVLELRGDLPAAAVAARAATRDEPTNWRTWLVLSRIEAFRGDTQAAVSAYKRARSLDPRSALFAR